MGTKVNQVDVYTDELIEQYDSLTEAAIDNYTRPRAIKHAINNTNGIMTRRELKFVLVEVDE